MKKKRRSIAYLTDLLEFPPIEDCGADGLLAVGGDLSPERLILAYSQGIFPWFNEDSLILWWCPDPRMVLFPANLKISKSMGRILESDRFRLSRNTCFDEVIEHCARVSRKGQDGTWITTEMLKAYKQLHRQGHAHSYEVWENDELVGGLYGVDLGNVFCGESMFSLVSNASKYAFIKMVRELAAENYRMIDCQLYSEHLASLGAEEISRAEFLHLLEQED